MPDVLRSFENLSDDQLAALWGNVLHELERISVKEFAQRLKVSVQAFHSFLQGNRPDRRLLMALSVYDFSPFPDLAQLMAAHFYESYDYDTGSLESWQPAVDDFIAGESSGRVAGAALDIRKLLATTAEDESIERTLQSLGCRFVFDAIKMTPRQWLEAVHDRLQQRDPDAG